MFFTKKKKTSRTCDVARCFSAAYEAAQVHAQEAPVIVHGVIRHRGRYLVYAWCEVDDMVYDYTLNMHPIPREYYYEGNNVVENGLKCYTYAEYRALLLKNSGFGPFEKTFFQNVITDLQLQK